MLFEVIIMGIVIELIFFVIYKCWFKFINNKVDFFFIVIVF